MIRFGGSRKDKYAPGEFERDRIKLRTMLEAAIADELKAQTEYRDLAMAMSDLGHNELVYEITEIMRDEKTHYITLKEIHKVLFRE